MKLWVDSLRTPPDGWTWAKSSSGAIDALCFGMVRQLSLGFDLSDKDATRAVLNWMRENRMWPRAIYVHSGNREEIERVLRIIDQHRT